MLDKEEWRIIPSLPGVRASSHGRLCVDRRVGKWRVYAGAPTLGAWDGKRYVFRWRVTGKTYRVGRLVCEAFHGASPPNTVAMHMDENARNNRPENLRWGSQKQNLNAPGFLNYCRSRTGDNNPYMKGR